MLNMRRLYYALAVWKEGTFVAEDVRPPGVTTLLET